MVTLRSSNMIIRLTLEGSKLAIPFAKNVRLRE